MRTTHLIQNVLVSAGLAAVLFTAGTAAALAGESAHAVRDSSDEAYLSHLARQRFEVARQREELLKQRLARPDTDTRASRTRGPAARDSWLRRRQIRSDIDANRQVMERYRARIRPNGPASAPDEGPLGGIFDGIFPKDLDWTDLAVTAGASAGGWFLGSRFLGPVGGIVGAFAANIAANLIKDYLEKNELKVVPRERYPSSRPPFRGYPPRGFLASYDGRGLHSPSPLPFSRGFPISPRAADRASSTRLATPPSANSTAMGRGATHRVPLASEIPPVQVQLATQRVDNLQERVNTTYGRLVRAIARNAPATEIEARRRVYQHDLAELQEARRSATSQAD